MFIYILFSDRIHQCMRLASEVREDDAMTLDDDSESWQGNRFRKLWKLACTQAVLNVSIFFNPFIFYATSTRPVTHRPHYQIANACSTLPSHHRPKRQQS
jgi:hypothetical protein